MFIGEVWANKPSLPLNHKVVCIHAYLAAPSSRDEKYQWLLLYRCNNSLCSLISPPPPSFHGDDWGELVSWRMVRGFYNFIPLLWTAMQFVVGAHIRLNICLTNMCRGLLFAKSEFVELQESTVDEHKQIASLTPRNSALLRATSLWARRPVVPSRSSDLLSPRATSLHPRAGSVYRSPAPCNCNYALYAVHTQHTTFIYRAAFLYRWTDKLSRFWQT